MMAINTAHCKQCKKYNGKAGSVQKYRWPPTQSTASYAKNMTAKLTAHRNANGHQHSALQVMQKV